MPRSRRVIRQSSLIHLIVRFLDKRRFLDTQGARHAYLERAAHHFGKSDWQLLSYALMSTHVHFGAIAGAAPLSAITQPLHVSFDHWLKSRQDVLGPVLAARPTTKELPLHAAPILIAYHHNNPVRAGVVAGARDSDWTSHHHYMAADAPSWLAVDVGLSLSGLGVTTRDRKLFEQFVYASSDSVLDDFDDFDDFDESDSERIEQAHTALGAAVTVGSPRLTLEGTVQCDLFALDEAALHPRWPGPLQELVDAVATRTGIPACDIRSRSRVRHVVGARRLFVLVAHNELHRPIGHVAAVVGISSSAARQLEQRASDGDRELAKAIAEEQLLRM